ncbi:hypothetical protein OF83DRAFT_523762 [Amylostereum chailletii]|nr:hypothetical protein OF83DRAFT_523762 [Amylostereum chailletii]
MMAQTPHSLLYERTLFGRSNTSLTTAGWRGGSDSEIHEHDSGFPRAFPRPALPIVPVTTTMSTARKVMVKVRQLATNKDETSQRRTQDRRTGYLNWTVRIFHLMKRENLPQRLATLPLVPRRRVSFVFSFHHCDALNPNARIYFPTPRHKQPCPRPLTRSKE